MGIHLSMRRLAMSAALVAGLSACGGGNDTAGVDAVAPTVQIKHLVPPVVADALCGGESGASYALLDGRCVAVSPLMASHAAAKLAEKRTVTADAFFVWAQATFPAFFSSVGASATVTADGYVYRLYASGNIVAVTTATLSGLAPGAVFIVGPLSGNALVNVGTLDGFSCSVDASTCATTPTTPSGSINSYADCFGSSLYTPGTTYQIDQSNTTNGAVVQTTSNKYTVNQPTTFKGNTATELLVNATVLTTTSTSQPAGSASTLKLYSGLSGSTYATFGSVLSFTVPTVGAISVTTYYAPPLMTPVGLTAGQTYQVNTTIKSESSSPLVPATADVAAAFTITFVGSEQVTTPAGTFLACKTTSQQVTGSTSTLTTNWLVGEGRYKGMFLKSDDGKGGMSVATKLLLNGS